MAMDPYRVFLLLKKLLLLVSRLRPRPAVLFHSFNNRFHLVKTQIVQREKPSKLPAVVSNSSSSAKISPSSVGEKASSSICSMIDRANSTSFESNSQWVFQLEMLLQEQEDSIRIHSHSWRHVEQRLRSPETGNVKKKRSGGVRIRSGGCVRNRKSTESEDEDGFATPESLLLEAPQEDELRREEETTIVTDNRVEPDISVNVRSTTIAAESPGVLPASSTDGSITPEVNSQVRVTRGSNGALSIQLTFNINVNVPNF
ncbi:hypothetical protein L596_008870 [Steinernema carpocapsae]|uniref:Uncharacterized protein n=1 Tax=Steinernema carpocapsae TaxID=34508 RepID=A0A4U5PDR0_STECR|nr:hypothetical protein L596_008870 [Steinernema carpocapsae]